MTIAYRGYDIVQDVMGIYWVGKVSFASLGGAKSYIEKQPV